MAKVRIRGIYGVISPIKPYNENITEIAGLIYHIQHRF
jgi:hypothetical protein